MKTLAVIVNYRVASQAVAAARSVLNSDSVGPVEVVVTDNSEDPEEASRLRSELPAGVILEVNSENVGFGRACRAVYDKFPSDLVLLLNPDARLLEGGLARLQHTLRQKKKAAAVAPDTLWHEGAPFHLPPSCPPALFLYQPLLARFGRKAWFERLLGGLWRRHAVKVWSATKPVRVRNLSGGLVLLERKAVEKAGGLFDPRFFLYFEDTDLFIRLRKAGYQLLTEPRAKAVHYYDQCAREMWKQKRAHMAESQRLFVEKHRNGWKGRLTERLGRNLGEAGGEIDAIHLREFQAPFEMEVPQAFADEWLFEWSPCRNFIPSMGLFGTGPRLDFSERCWDMLAPGRYFGRIGPPKGCGGKAAVISWLVEDPREGKTHPGI